jgi:hypothetical protein
MRAVAAINLPVDPHADLRERYILVARDDMNELHAAPGDGGDKDLRRCQFLAWTALLHRTVDDNPPMLPC